MLLYTIILLEGFVTISLEILTIRQLIPVVGNSVTVTSLIIGIFLLFLAYGYRKGGLYQSNYHRILKNNFTLAALGLGVGLSYSFISVFFSQMSRLAPGVSLLPLLLYLLLIISPIVYLLGQTVPITLNLWKKDDSLGKIGGQVLHLSTIGSFFGASLTALLFLNYCGVAWTIFIDFLFLAILACLLMDLPKESYRLLMLVALTICVYTVNIELEKNTFIATNSYGNYAILDHSLNKTNHGKVLNINDSYSSYLNNKKQGFAYIELIKKILFTELKLNQQEILVLGAGGFSLSAESDKHNHFTYVDIDKDILKIVKKHFLNSVNGSFVADDARHYLMTLDKQKHFNVIISDAYSNRTTIVPHLLTQEYFISLREALAENGLAIFNMIAKPTFSDAYSKHLDNTLRSVFSNCMAIPQRYSDQPTNIIYVCKKSAAQNDKLIYTDNLNRASLDYQQT